MSFSFPDKLNFKLDAATIKTQLEDVLVRSRKLYDDVAAQKEPTFASTFAWLDRENAKMQAEEASLYFPMYVSTDAEARTASSDAQQALEKLSTELAQREDVYNVLKRVAEATSTDDAVDTRLMRKTLLSFERNGIALQKDKRDAYKANQERQSELSTLFQKDLNEDTTSLLFADDELAGLPTDFVKELDVDDATKKKKLTLKYPHLFPVLKFCAVPATRRAMEEANGKKCAENVARLAETLKLRREAAALLGYATHADYVLEERMAKSPATVATFIDELATKLRAKLDAEKAQLLALKRETEGADAAGALYSHDWRFYMRLLKEREHALDENKIKEYFPLAHVTDVMLDIYSRLFGVVFKRVADLPSWHDDVQSFVVTNKDGSEALGALYVDLHPRDGKYGHAAAFPLIGTYEDESKQRVQVVTAMVANFTAPSKDGSVPSLLKHDEVVTYFHELGHCVHNLLSKSKYARFSGTSVERDFVEAPSQFLENWCYDKAMLRRISSHYQSKEPLPDALIDAIVAAKTADAGIHNSRQLFFAGYDQALHGADALKYADGGAATAFWHELWESRTGIVDAAHDTHPQASFAHIVGGYDAQYYGYMWSEVYSSDMFSIFERDGLENEATGAKYAAEILAPGGTRDSMDGLKAFLGREPNNEAFLKHIGLTQ